MIKQNIAYLLIFTITLTKLVAQNAVNLYDNDGKRHGIWTKNYHQTNQLRYKGEFRHGKEIDTFKYYRLNKGKSVLSAVKVFSEKDSLAEVIFYASNAKIISKGVMNGKRYIGKWLYYHKNSNNIMTIEHYNDNGLLHGIKKVYFINGILAEESNYSNGKRDGRSHWYNEDNTLLRTSEYSDGQLNGRTANYDSNGILVSEGQYNKDSKRGIWKYYKDGQINKEIDHTNNKVIKKYN